MKNEYTANHAVLFVQRVLYPDAECRGVDYAAGFEKTAAAVLKSKYAEVAPGS